MARCTFCERRTLCALGGSNRSRCGAVRTLSVRSDPLRTLGGSNRSRCGAVHIWAGRIALAVARCAFEDRTVVQKCRSQVSSRHVVQKRRLGVWFGSVDRSVAWKCRSEVLLEVSIRSVEQKCCSDVSLTSAVRSVDQKCCSEL